MFQHILPSDTFDAVVSLLNGNATPEQKQQLKQYVERQASIGPQDDDSKYAYAAKRKYLRFGTDGDVSFDDDPMMSHGGDGGSFVNAWLWVSDEEAGVKST